MLLNRISPRYWIPFLELSWGICTLVTYKVTSVKGLYVVRFFVGLLEVNHCVPVRARGQAEFSSSELYLAPASMSVTDSPTRSARRPVSTPELNTSVRHRLVSAISVLTDHSPSI